VDVAVVKDAAPRWRRPLRLLALAVVLCAAAWGLPACFNPQQPGCAFSCASDGVCPAGYSCGTDQLCRRTDGQGSCSVSHLDDASLDGQTSDAAPGGATHDGSGPE
jgi:hypothetical protein